MPDIAGLKLIVPTSATATGAGSSATVSATGKLTFTSAATLSVNGVFTSSQDNYLFVMQLTVASDATLTYKLRASGTDTSSGYAYQDIYASSTTVSSGGRDTAQAAARFGSFYTTARNGCHMYFYGPNLVQPTAARSITVSSASGAYIQDYASTQSGSTAFDGFTIGGGTITGTMTIYGLSQ